MNTYPRVAYRDVPLFKNVSEKDWNDWKWQFRNVIRDIETLKKVILVDAEEERDLEKVWRMRAFPWGTKACF